MTGAWQGQDGMGVPRWPAVLAAGFLIGLAMAWWPQWAAAGPAAPPPARDGVDWLFALGLATAWRCLGRAAWGPMAWCGLMRDLFLGGRPGANALLYLAAGLAAARWRRDGARLSGWAARWLAGAALALGAALLRPALEAPSFWVAYAPDGLAPLAVSGLWTAAMLPLAEAVTALPRLRTWRPADILEYQGPSVFP